MAAYLHETILNLSMLSLLLSQRLKDVKEDTILPSVKSVFQSLGLVFLSVVEYGKLENF